MEAKFLFDTMVSFDPNLHLPCPVDVTLISPINYFNFTPLLASCAVGTLEFRCAIEPVHLSHPTIVLNNL